MINDEKKKTNEALLMIEKLEAKEKEMLERLKKTQQKSKLIHDDLGMISSGRAPVSGMIHYASLDYSPRLVDNNVTIKEKRTPSERNYKNGNTSNKEKKILSDNSYKTGNSLYSRH